MGNSPPMGRLRSVGHGHKESRRGRRGCVQTLSLSRLLSDLPSSLSLSLCVCVVSAEKTIFGNASLSPPRHLQTLIPSSLGQPPSNRNPNRYQSSPAMASAVDPASSRRNLSSPWSHVVRGEQDSVTADPYSPSSSSISSPELTGRSPRKTSADAESPLTNVDRGGSGNAADAAPVTQGKKPAWNIPSNGAIEVGSVMDTLSWPALSESAKVSPKSSSSDSLKAVSDGSVSAAPNPMSPSHKSMKRGAGGSSGSSSEASNAGCAMPSFLAVSEPSHVMPGNQLSSEPSPKGSPNKNTSNNNGDRDHGLKSGGFSPQPHSGNEHHRGYGGGRRGTNGNKRDEWSHRNFGRDVHMQQPYQQRGVRPYARPPAAAAAPFIAPPPPLRPFPNHMGFPDFPSPMYYVAAPVPESLRGVPFTQQPPAPQMMFFPAPDPQRAVLLKQIDYYFSPENLCKDIYLRQNMDEKGWVPISLIAGFNRVKQLTNNMQYILDTVQLSTVVEVQDEKIRKRNDWMSWLLHPAERTGSASNLQAPTTSIDGIAAQFHNVCLDAPDAPKHTGFKGSAQNEVGLTRSASGNLNSHLSVVRDSMQGGDNQFSNSDLWNVRSLVRSDTM